MKLTEKYTDISYIEFHDDRPQVVFKDKEGGKVSYRGENRERKKLIAYKIDGGIMKNQTGKWGDVAGITEWDITYYSSGYPTTIFDVITKK